MSALEISADAIAPQQQQQGEAPKKVSFAFPPPALREADLCESARLLEHQAFSSFPRHSSDDGSPRAGGSCRMVPPSPQVLTATATALPHNFGTPPENMDAWPKEPLRIPCTRCGHFIETTTNEETGGAPGHARTHHACTHHARMHASSCMHARTHHACMHACP